MLKSTDAVTEAQARLIFVGIRQRRLTPAAQLEFSDRSDLAISQVKHDIQDFGQCRKWAVVYALVFFNRLQKLELLFIHVTFDRGAAIVGQPAARPATPVEL